MTTTTTTPPLDFDQAVAWAYDHSGHFTSEPSKVALLRLASAVTPQFRSVQWRSPHGEDITVTYYHSTETYVCEATQRAEPAGTTLLRELRHSRGIDGTS